ncbi:hypothetical protein C1708_01840 [Streptomyces sp. DH-12]|uniref:DUF4328 domain-containing protein n=1 Tax=unclassified Streptomyces TaxID=2593676 RepID=UPI000CCF11BB|nr:DUF4328 domain-containing protein [Streptomyces sp. DH-12]PNV31208.1 hypothetical protein C1708_01840 [Streptomyces sp. DH-12]
MAFSPVPVKPMSGPGPVLRSPLGLAHAVTALLAVVIVADVMHFGAAAYMRSVMGEVTSGGAGDVDMGAVDRADTAVASSSLLYLIGVVGTATLFIIWFHRVRHNAEVFAPDTQRRTPGWAIGGWFIPLANLWIPRGIARDVLRASQPDPYASELRHHRLLNAWWGMWIASNLFDRLASEKYDAAEDPQAVHDAAGWLMAGSVLDLVSAVLALLFVRRLTAAQNAKAMAGSAFPPAPQHPAAGGPVPAAGGPVPGA